MKKTLIFLCSLALCSLFFSCTNGNSASISFAFDPEPLFNEIRADNGETNTNSNTGTSGSLGNLLDLRAEFIVSGDYNAKKEFYFSENVLSYMNGKIPDDPNFLIIYQDGKNYLQTEIASEIPFGAVVNISVAFYRSINLTVINTQTELKSYSGSAQNVLVDKEVIFVALPLSKENN